MRNTLAYLLIFSALNLAGFVAIYLSKHGLPETLSAIFASGVGR